MILFGLCLVALIACDQDSQTMDSGVDSPRPGLKPGITVGCTAEPRCEMASKRERADPFTFSCEWQCLEQHHVVLNIGEVEDCWTPGLLTIRPIRDSVVPDDWSPIDCAPLLEDYLSHVWH